MEKLLDIKVNSASKHEQETREELAYVNQRFAVGLEIKDQKPEIIINLSSTRAEGSDFSANLLKLCRIID